MRQIVLDTETTGLDPRDGDRVVEIGCVELVNHIPTGEVYQTYLNPQRAMSEGAAAVSGITDDQLKDKPLFQDIASDFLSFLGGSPLVIHNAKFDLGFLNHELFLAGRPPLDNPVEDTVVLARRKFPGSPASLDALCRRFEIDLSERAKHGALLDARLLARVYLELVGGRQHGLALGLAVEGTKATVSEGSRRVRPVPLEPRLNEAEIALHRALVRNELGADAAWLKLLGKAP